MAPGAAAPDGGARHAKQGDGADALVLEQLIVGVLLFTPLLLLLPTTLVFFTFATLLYWGFLSVRIAVAASAAVLRANPAYCIVHRLLCPAAYPSGIWLEALPPPEPRGQPRQVRTDAATAGEKHYLRLVSIPCSIVVLLMPCWTEIRSALGNSTVFMRMTRLLHDWSTSVI